MDQNFHKCSNHNFHILMLLSNMWIHLWIEIIKENVYFEKNKQIGITETEFNDAYVDFFLLALCQMFKCV